MSLNDEMTGLMDVARNVTQLTDKMSISDLTSYIVGLAPINYLDNPIDEQTIETKNGDYGEDLSSAQLEEGTYCLSAQISHSQDFIGLRVNFRGGVAQPLDSGNSVHDWGFVSLASDWVQPGKANTLVLPFKVTKAGKLDFGVAANPFTGGEAKVDKMMLNKGNLPLPFTKNKLGG